MELEVEGQSFMIETSIEPADFNYQAEENIEIKDGKISRDWDFEANVFEINSENFIENPWKVCNLKEFLRFHCPECGFLSIDENEFHSHAIENHDQAQEIWGKGVATENISAQTNEMADANSYQESKTLLEEKVAKTDEIDLEPNIELVDIIGFQESKIHLEEDYSSQSDRSDLESETDMLEVQSYKESKTLLEENGNAKSVENDCEEDIEITEVNNDQESHTLENFHTPSAQDDFFVFYDKESKMLLEVKIGTQSDLEPNDEMEKEQNPQKSKPFMKVKDRAKIDKEPNFEFERVNEYEKAKIIMEESSDTKIIDVPTIIQARDKTQTMDIDFDSFEVQNIIENTDMLFGYNDFRDNFDRYSINTSLDSSQWIKNESDLHKRKYIIAERELKLVSNLPFIRKVNHILEKQSEDNFEKFKERNTRKLIVKICDKTKEFLCPIEGCKVKCKLIHKLQNHIVNHTNPREKQEIVSVQCKHCGWKTEPPGTKMANWKILKILNVNMRKLEKHLFYHHNSNHVSDFICDICGKKFYELDDLEKHKTMFHGDNKVCETCAKTFNTLSDLYKHRNTHTNSKLMKCGICGKKIKGANRLKVHKERAHQNETLRACHICHKVLYNRCELYKHYINDHNNVENPVQIDGKYVFQCEYCKKILGSLAAHYTHIKLTHKMKKTASEIKVTKKQKCPFCIEENLSSRDYVIHLVNEHPDKEPPNDLKNLENGFSCSDCDEIYQSPMFYYRHLKFNHEKIEPGYVKSKHVDKKFTEGV